MSTATIYLSNGILFVFDRANKVVNTPEYMDGQIIAANDSCVSIGTQASVDGDVTVTLERMMHNVPGEGMKRRFSGNLSSPGRMLSIVTAEATTILECEVDGTTPQIEVWGDDERNPTRIIVLTN
jgi:hypothetical protein